jgi:hypothetical protein
MGEAIFDYFASPNRGKRSFMVPTSSRTASIHVALGGLIIPAKREAIIPPITEIGTVMPIILLIQFDIAVKGERLKEKTCVENGT